MADMVEIEVVVPKKIKICVPKHLFEQFEQMVDEEDLSTVLTEALSEELKKVRFRLELGKAASSRVA